MRRDVPADAGVVRSVGVPTGVATFRVSAFCTDVLVPLGHGAKAGARKAKREAGGGGREEEGMGGGRGTLGGVGTGRGTDKPKGSGFRAV